MEDFNLRKFLKENKLIVNTKILKEDIDSSEDVKSTKGGSLRDRFLAVGTPEELNQYLDSLKKDLQMSGPKNYEGFSKSDYIEDFKNYIADKGLDEDIPGFGVGGSHKDNPIINAVEKGISKIGKYAKKFDKFMEPYGKAAAGSMREADRGLDEDIPGFGVGGSHKDNPIINAVEKGISKIGKYAKKFDKFMEPYGKAAAGSMRENEESTNFDERWQESEDPELLDRLDGLANRSDFKELQDLLRIVGSEWMNEDFTKEEIKSMLNFLVDEI
jgi:hypothetical protein